MMTLLSYPLGLSTPAYGNGESPSITMLRSMEKGDSSNLLEIRMTNHTGTHVDAPRHFDVKGKSITDFPANFWDFSNVGVAFLPRCPEPGELIDSSMLDGASRELTSGIEALILNTGWHTLRETGNYAICGPGIHSSVADFLRQRFPKLRLLGFDMISLSSFAHREAGRESHRSFLCHTNPILIVEDMNLHELHRRRTLHRLLVSPLFIEDADGSPCTIWGELS